MTAHTPSDLMVESQAAATTPAMVLPDRNVQAFLLEVIDQTNFPGKLSEFVSQVKHYVQSASLKG